MNVATDEESHICARAAMGFMNALSQFVRRRGRRASSCSLGDIASS